MGGDTLPVVPTTGCGGSTTTSKTLYMRRIIVMASLEFALGPIGSCIWMTVQSSIQTFSAAKSGHAVRISGWTGSSMPTSPMVSQGLALTWHIGQRGASALVCAAGHALRQFAPRMVTVIAQITANPLIMFASKRLKVRRLVRSKRAFRAKGQYLVLQTFSALATTAEWSLQCQQTVCISSPDEVETS